MKSNLWWLGIEDSIRLPSLVWSKKGGVAIQYEALACVLVGQCRKLFMLQRLLHSFHSFHSFPHNGTKSGSILAPTTPIFWDPYPSLSLLLGVGLNTIFIGSPHTPIHFSLVGKGPRTTDNGQRTHYGQTDKRTADWKPDSSGLIRTELRRDPC